MSKFGPVQMPPSKKGRGAETTALLKGVLVLSIPIICLPNYFFYTNNYYFPWESKPGARAAVPPPSTERILSSPQELQQRWQHKKSVSSYWWPSEADGGLFGRIYAMQNPPDCSSAKFLVWQSMKDNERDTRGLTAWVRELFCILIPLSFSSWPFLIFMWCCIGPCWGISSPSRLNGWGSIRSIWVSCADHR